MPYDVVDTEEARALAAGNPYSFLHVSRAEIDLPAGTDPYSDRVYAHRRDTLRRYQTEGLLAQEPRPQLYVYQQKMGSHLQRGVVACLAASDYESHVIKTHEKTRQDKEDDRARHIRILTAQSGPVAALVEAAQRQKPMFDFTAPDGIGHAGWRFPDPQAAATAFGRVPVAYIADGHHRAAAAVRVARERRVDNPRQTGDEEYNWFLGVLFPASEVQILPYNRCVRDLNGLNVNRFLEEVGARFAVRVSSSSVVFAGLGNWSAG